MTKKNAIYDLLKEGKTPEQLIKELNDAQRQIKEEEAEAAEKAQREAEKKEALEADRADVANALIWYMYDLDVIKEDPTKDEVYDKLLWSFIKQLERKEEEIVSLVRVYNLYGKYFE